MARNNTTNSKGPFGFLNPTTRYVKATGSPGAKPAVNGAKSGGPPDEDVWGSAGIYHLWRSRDNRKGRHAILGMYKKIPTRIAEDHVARHSLNHPHATDTLRESMRGIGKMFVRYPVWDVSYDVALIFTLGSVIWVINGFFVWLPVQYPSTRFSGEVTTGGGITAFIGATVFEFGSILLMLEAVNENKTDCFGWALEEAFESRGVLLRPAPEECDHHHSVKQKFLSDPTSSEKENHGRTWEWWPTWHELKTHYFRELGFLACLSQFIGATIFWIAGFTSLSPIYESLSVRATNGAYWSTQVIGGTGFIISSWLFMVETQSKWYIIAPTVLGWHIGFWNLVGALGFTLCGALTLGFASENETASYVSVYATFIGSLAFLIGSAIQWYESLDKYPISVEKKMK
ncbi:hypothetical protein GGR57DRAFT_496214 [Xylariaceae sp. FL1272]|nr:hypothetical protein GGR57DRAFT_496214 [Xylariaceae sp. FL1272]